MTYRHIGQIHERLDDARHYRRRLHRGERLASFVLAAAGLVLFCTLLGGFGELPAMVRWLLLLVGCGGLLTAGICWVLRPLRADWNRVQMACRVEGHFPHLHNALINAVQLAEQPDPRSPGIIDRCISEAARSCSGCDFHEPFSPRPLLRRVSVSAALLLALAVYASLWPERFQSAAAQLLHPGALSPAGGLAEIRVLPGHQTVFAGDDFTARAFVLAGVSDADTLEAWMHTDLPGESRGGEVASGLWPTRSSPHAMTRSGNPGFLYVFRDVRKPFQYWVESGGSSSPPYQVSVAHRPEVARIDALYEFPAYTRLQPRREENIPGPLKAVQGTRVRLRVRVGPEGKKLAAAQLGLASASEAPRTEISPEGDAFQTVFVLEKNDAYSIHLRDSEGNSSRAAVADHPITATLDRPPGVTLVRPGKAASAAPGETLSVRLEAADDFGVDDLFVLARVNDSPVERLVGWQEFPDPRFARVEHEWWIDPDRYRPGDTVRYHAEAVDGNPRPGRASTGEYVLRIIDPRERIEATQKSVEEWERDLRAVLELQREARTDTEAAAARPGEETLKGIRPLLGTQVDVRTRTLAIVQKMPARPGPQAAVHKTLAWLTANPMTEAVQRMEQAASRAAAPEAAEDLRQVLPVQDRIVETLERILQVMPKLRDAPPPPPETAESASDLPDDGLKDGMEQLAKGLEEFLKEQRKVVDATADLAKRPVDDLTSEDDAALRGLEAKEDRWSDFMKDTFSDLSKVPEQDFSNPSLLKELIAIQSEIEMAKDALAQKAVQIATPLEENGAELAEALTTHLEKWLPETPDREQWQMEEPLGEYSTPMAELPKELEDIIGELLEAEEDLFEEMEDTSSSWADSMDKGAGWDAADGPISNMSAQGVTGNRLPNSSEIGGRSGEGRTGKSSGEFVEESAQGLGGRRTPTRLTPDPFESGSVKDTSPETGGGSTGGGKESGAGSEGLEGPSPDQHNRIIQSLAQQQAELRNRAEKIKLQLQVSNYPALFEETLDNLRAVEDDLRSGRYQDAFRRRAVLLGNLRAGREFLQNEVRIHRDTTPAMPDREQEMILDAMTGPVPKGYEEALKNYYQAISRENEPSSMEVLPHFHAR
ncbi:MAG: hypothetical protein HYU36_05240 [Planctomycetes bacterium]|nr:hypothetical protein [Planctomycetota bacterium]